MALSNDDLAQRKNIPVELVAVLRRTRGGDQRDAQRVVRRRDSARYSPHQLS
jgi:hypothetical protein